MSVPGRAKGSFVALAPLSVSCGGSGSCVAIGAYKDGNGNGHPLIETGNVPVPNPGLIVSFGDSVAASEGNPVALSTIGTSCTSPPGPYCGYDDGEWTDSSDAYPSLLGYNLGDSVDNFAVSGACAVGSTKGGLSNCKSPTGKMVYPDTSVYTVIGKGKKAKAYGQLETAKALNLDPSLITLTVGADDINFKACEPGVLLLQALQAHDVLGAHGLVLRPPALIGRDRNLQVAADGRDVGSLSEEPVGLSELSDDLLWSMAPAPHESHLLPTSWAS